MHPGLSAGGEADVVRRRHLVPHPEARQRSPDHRADRPPHRDRRGHRRGPALPRRRGDLRHRLSHHRNAVADDRHRARRGALAGYLAGRPARLPRHHRSALPQPVLHVRAEYQRGGERQHHRVLGVRNPLRHELPQAAAGVRTAQHGVPAGGARRLQPVDRRRQWPHCLGSAAGAQLVQER